MTSNYKNLLLVLVLSLAILLGACAPAASNSSIIATSVAATVQAQNTQEAAAATPTLEPATPTTEAVTTPTDAAPTKAPPTAPTGTGSNQCTASATFVGETIPDGTIMSPGQIFTKIWHIKNTGTCPWNSSWKLVYSSGDVMGGAFLYNFPGVALPGDTVDVPVVLTAPASNGTYTGFWKIQSPWGFVFGDVSGNAYSVSIVVGSGTPANSKTETVYNVTSVTYDDPVRRCTGANTFWTVTAHISSNGPLTVVYTWAQSDGNNHRNNKLVFDSATTLSVTSPSWSQGIASSPNPRWVQVIETSPTYREFSKSPPLILCGH